MPDLGLQKIEHGIAVEHQDEGQAGHGRKAVHVLGVGNEEGERGAGALEP